MSEDFEQMFHKTIKLKSLEDKRKKDEFLCIDEWDLPNLFKDPVLTEQMMIEHVVDNDYHSDEDQILANKVTL